MANGKVHQTATLLFAGVSYAGLSWLTPQPVALTITGGILLNLLMPPDVDIADSIQAKKLAFSLPYIGWIFGRIWWAIWWPYGEIVPHRSIFSHGFIIGALTRGTYLIGITFGLAFIFGIHRTAIGAAALIAIASQPPVVFLRLLIGLTLSDIIHILLDL